MLLKPCTKPVTVPDFEALERQLKTRREVPCPHGADILAGETESRLISTQNISLLQEAFPLPSLPSANLGPLLWPRCPSPTALDFICLCLHLGDGTAEVPAFSISYPDRPGTSDNCSYELNFRG